MCAFEFLSITHLLFAYENYLFFRANMEQCSQIKVGLQVYEKASGQKVNFKKSSVMFSPNIPEDEKKGELYTLF